MCKVIQYFHTLMTIHTRVQKNSVRSRLSSLAALRGTNSPTAPTNLIDGAVWRYLAFMVTRYSICAIALGLGSLSCGENEPVTSAEPRPQLMDPADDAPQADDTPPPTPPDNSPVGDDSPADTAEPPQDDAPLPDADAELDAGLPTPDAPADSGVVDTTDASPALPECTGQKVVHFVYFVEGDAEFSQAQLDAIEKQAFAFQQYWYEQLGVTFYLNRPVVDVIEAEHDSTWYLETPDGIHNDERWYRLGNVKTEVYDKLSIRDFDPNHRVVNYPTLRYDGRVGGNFGGAWMDGDDLGCMLGENGGVNYPYPDGTAAHCLGHVAHEFGHVLGLDHEGPQTDCMQYGFYNNSGGDGMCSFSQANVEKILAASQNDGWFNAMPGDTCEGI